MKTRTASLAAIVALVSAALSVPLAAHHGTNISYDRSKQFTKQATVTGDASTTSNGGKDKKDKSEKAADKADKAADKADKK